MAQRFGLVLEPLVDLVGLEGLELHVEIEEVLVADLLEIVVADLGRVVVAPVVGDALVGDGAAGGEARDPVGARAERRLERRGADVALLAVGVGAFPPVLGAGPMSWPRIFGSSRLPVWSKVKVTSPGAVSSALVTLA